MGAGVSSSEVWVFQAHGGQIHEDSQPHKEALLLPGGDPARGFSPAGLPARTKQPGGTAPSLCPQDPQEVVKWLQRFAVGGGLGCDLGRVPACLQTFPKRTAWTRSQKGWWAGPQRPAGSCHLHGGDGTVAPGSPAARAVLTHKHGLATNSSPSC